MKHLFTLAAIAAAATVSAVELDTNLLADGDFEKGNQFINYKTWRMNGLSVVPSPDFFSGEKSLKIVKDANTWIAVQTRNPLPIIPGKTIELKFWMKSAGGNVPGSATLDFAQPNQNRHLYKTFNFQIGPEWKEFTFEYAVPADTDAYTGLKAGTCRLRLGLKNSPDAAEAYLDEVEFRRK